MRDDHVARKKLNFFVLPDVGTEGLNQVEV